MRRILPAQRALVRHDKPLTLLLAPMRRTWFMHFGDAASMRLRGSRTAQNGLKAAVGPPPHPLPSQDQVSTFGRAGVSAHGRDPEKTRF